MVSAGTGGVEPGCMKLWGYIMTTRLDITKLEKCCQADKSHKPLVKLTRKRSTGKPYAAFDEAGAGNGLKGTAPVLDPTTREGRAGNSSALLYHFYSKILRIKVQNDE